MDEEKVETKKSFFSRFKKKQNEEKKEQVKRVSFLQLFRFSTKLDYALMLIGLLASLATGTSLPAMVVVFGNMTDSFVDIGKNVTERLSQDAPSVQIFIDEKIFWDRMIEAVISYLIIGAVVLVTGYVQLICWLTVSYRQSFKIRNNVFKAILRQDIGWFDTNDVGTLTTRLSADVNKIQEGIGDKMSTFFQWISSFISGIIIGFVKGPKLAAVVISISPLLAISGGLMAYIISSATNKELEAYAKAGSVAEEVFSAIRTVVAFSGQEKAIEKYSKNLDKAKRQGIKKGTLSGMALGVALGIIFCSYALAFWYGGVLIRSEEMTTGEVFTVFFAVVIGAFSLGNCGPSLQSINAARGASYSLWEILDRVPVIDSSSNEGKILDSLIGNIEFKDVHFNYPSRKTIQILKGLKMKLDKSLTVAIVGESGCGKSTVIQLLERFYDPEKGHVLIDGVDIKDMNINWLRQQIGVVNQEPILFSTTIGKNISYGINQEASQAKIEEAAKRANAHEFIINLPKKYDTLVGERGAHLSGGQKQRIAIARSLMRNPKIMLLDEATSALDNESESIVQAALDKVRFGRTTIVVAHRLSTIRNADIIFGIKDGVVYESGNHEELMDKKGIYYALVTNQGGDRKREKAHSEADTEDEDIEESLEEVDLKRTISIRNSKAKRKRTFSKVKKTEEEEEIEKYKDVSIKRLMALNKPEWYFLVMGSIGALIHGAIQPSFAVLFSKFIEVFIDEENMESRVALIAGLFAIIGLIAFLSMLLMSSMFSISGERLTKRVRILLFKHILKQNIEFFDDNNNSVGALVTRLSTDASAIQGGTGARLGMFFQAVSSLGVGIIIGFVYSWKMTLLVLGCMPLLLIGAMLEMRLTKGFSGENNAALDKAGKIATEAISNIRTVVILCKEKHFSKIYHDSLYGPYKHNLRTAHFTSFSYSLSQSLIYFCYSAIFALGGHLVRINDLSSQDMFLVFGAIIFGAMAMGQASQFAPDYSKVKISLGRIFTLLDSEPSIDIYAQTGISPEKIEGVVNFTDVSFAYPSRSTAVVLKDFNLKVDPGTSVALVGFSGSGKSTTIQLLERFYDCLSGSIMVDHYNIKSVNVLWLRSQIGLVQQEPILFDCSIRENIEYGDNSRSVSMDEVIEAAKRANIANFIKTLPEGYETNVGDKGVQMSGGQKQRIAIARALIRNPKILLLDEATSALDTESEKVVQEALQKAQVGRTSIVIAHRLSTIQNSDCIFVFNKGQIAELGTHTELIAKKGIYYKLIESQG